MKYASVLKTRKRHVSLRASASRLIGTTDKVGFIQLYAPLYYIIHLLFRPQNNVEKKMSNIKTKIILLSYFKVNF